MTTTSSDNLHALRTGVALHEYVVDEVLGVGGFGVTYLANDTHLNMRVAIKEYLPAALAVRLGDSTVHPKSVADEETYRCRMRQLSGKPNRHCASTFAFSAII